MGGCYSRDQQTLQTKCRHPESSPRDVMRLEQIERKDEPGFRGASPRAWEWRAGQLKVPQRGGHAGSNYRQLSLQDDGADNVMQGSDEEVWVAEWLESVESGELDVYTCLGLSNAFTWTPDTQKMILKVFGVSVLQIMVPCIMLFQETAGGIRFRPMVSNFGFRLIGMALYLYSVYSMYNNALDECRSRLLAFAFKFQLPSGYWLPLVLGELSNVLVSVVLVLTLYVIFTNVSEPADLILNAVAVNFLGSVDAEFVNEDMKKDALDNFKLVTSACLQSEKDDDVDDGRSQLLDKILKAMLYFIAGAGCFLGFLFLLCPSEEGLLDDRIHGKGKIGKDCECYPGSSKR